MTLTTSIRVANESDALGIATVHVVSWQKIYRGHIPDIILNSLSINEREKQWLELIKNNVKIFVLEFNNQIIGFASIGPSRDSDADARKCGEISAIYLHPDYWHQGLGRMLCDKAFSELESIGFNEVTIWVLKENRLARKFYEKMGFKETGDIKADNYNNNVILDEVRYRKELNPCVLRKDLL